MSATALTLVLAVVLAAVGATPMLQPQQRIINGQPAGPNQFPWQVYVQGRLNNNAQTLCGGALVGPAHILTAANCVVGFE